MIQVIRILVVVFLTLGVVAYAKGKFGPSVRGFDAAVTEREVAVGKKQAELDKKERRLREKEKILNKQIRRYEKVIADLNKKLKKARTYDQEKFENLKKIYEQMEAKRAAKILEKSDTELVAGILVEMRKGQAGEILGLMDSAKARKVTRKLSDGITFRQPTSN